MLTEYAAEDGRLTERYIRYYEEKAKGGWGLIIAEDNAVEPRRAGFKNLPGVWSDELMEEHRLRAYSDQNGRILRLCQRN